MKVQLTIKNHVEQKKVIKLMIYGEKWEVSKLKDTETHVGSKNELSRNFSSSMEYCKQKIT